MRNILKVIALAMVIGTSTAAYAQQKSITITGIPTTYRNKIAMLALAPSVNNTNYAAVCLVKISGASTAFPLQDSKTKSPWSGNGNFAFSILIYNDVQAVQNQQYIYFGQTTGTTNVSQTTTTIQ